MEYTGTATGTTVQYVDIMNFVCLCEAKVARTAIVLCDNMHSCQLLTKSDRDTVFSSSAIFNDFKSACLRGLSLHVQTLFFDFAQILLVCYLWFKNVSSKGIFLAAFGVRHTRMPLPNVRQTGSVNSTCQLKWPFNRFSSCHTNPFEYHSQQTEQLAAVMRMTTLLFFWSSNMNRILNEATAKNISDFPILAQQTVAYAY